MEGVKKKIFRKNSRSKSESVSVNPQLDLFTCLDAKNTNEIRNIIQRNSGIINKYYGRPYFSPILSIALQEKAKTTSIEVIKVLIEFGARLYSDNEEWNTNGFDAIHYAALGGNPQFIKYIITRIDPEKINSTTNYGYTALLLLIKDGDAKDLNFIKCIKVLLENNININKTDNKNVSAIYWAADRKYRDVINMLLEYENIDLDSVTCWNETARNLLRGMEVDVSNIPIYISEDLKKNSEMLISYLKTNKESEFEELANEIGINNEDINEQTYLQYACVNHLLKVVEYLLSQNVDVNKTSRQNTQRPIEIAADNGYHKIFKLLIENPSINVINPVLPKILKNFDYRSSDKVNYYLCYEYLMAHGNIDVNVKDINGHYPLHYGAKYGGPDVASTLLSSKASLGNKNDFGFLTIEDVDYETLHNHLDNCIEAAQESKILDKKDWTISFDYATLLPTSEKVDNDINLVDEVEQPLNKEVSSIVLETEAIRYMSGSAELKSLLKHPVITSFLDMKWHRIRWIFIMNVLFYLTFCLALVLHSITLFYSPNGEGFTTYVFLLFMLILLIIREAFQCKTAPSKYLLNVENGFEILLITVIWLLSIKTPCDKTRNQLCASAFLFAAFGLLYLLGNHPSLSTKIVMLRTVSYTFLNFFVSYSILIIAFAFSFHILFNDTSSLFLSVPTNSTESNQGDNNLFFINPFVSMFKTLIMLTGDFDTSSLKFKHYPVTSHLIFLFFVITIAVILLNLLNGLAVSDTQIIMNEAELVGHIARAEFIYYVESLVFSSLLTSGFLYRCYNLVSQEKQNINKTRLTLKTLAEKICLFPNFPEEYKLIVYPNQKGKAHIKFEENTKWGWVSFYLDTKCIQKAKTIIQEKKEKEKRKYEKEEEKRRIDDLHTKINGITTILQSLCVNINNAASNINDR